MKKEKRLGIENPLKGNNIAIIRKIKEAVTKIDSSVQLILFGSRARGNAKNNSDWDLLILVNKQKVTVKDEELFRDKLYDLALATEQAISTLVYSKKDWDSKLSVTPLYENIKREGIYL